MKKIYIAGPDVFERNSIEIGKNLIQLCKEYGYEGLYPLDNIVDFSQEKQKIASDIYKANVEMINKADIVVANLNSFRGKEADSGTVWECGYAYALGKKVYGYMSDTKDYREHFNNAKEEDSIYFDEENRVIENFNHPINLMIACSCKEIVKGTFLDVLKKISS